ncbi:hypothetical protein NHQ30_007433 [Ciborinia camelliae]|nr:hypothetical protein NHQ30_007433 [Ciborinia camelliae]
MQPKLEICVIFQIEIFGDEKKTKFGISSTGINNSADVISDQGYPVDKLFSDLGIHLGYYAA